MPKRLHSIKSHKFVCQFFLSCMFEVRRVMSKNILVLYMVPLKNHTTKKKLTIYMYMPHFELNQLKNHTLLGDIPPPYPPYPPTITI